MQRGADAFELDVRLTADGAPVVIHDDTLDRTTDRIGAGALPHPRRAAVGGRRGEVHLRSAAGPIPTAAGTSRIPTLGEVLWAFPRMPVLLEIKEPEAQEAVRRVLVQEDAVERCVVASEHQEALQAFEEPPFARGASGRRSRRSTGRRCSGSRPPAAALPPALGARALSGTTGARPGASWPRRGRWAARCTSGPWTTPPPPGACGRGGWRGS